MPPSDASLPTRQVACHLEFTLAEDSVLALQIAAAAPPEDRLDERFDILVDGVAAPHAVTELATAVGGRLHVVRAPKGVLDLRYAASVAPPGPDPATGAPSAAGPVYDDEGIVALRQSRYCPSDALEGFAAAEFPGLVGAPDLGEQVASWVFERLSYEPGSSGPHDTALETLALNAGVCRDYAHLTISLCRALGLPARLAAVYAPGLSPMEFHAVVEVRSGNQWRVLDPTRLAPRSSLVRIATGRDAADIAFSTTLTGDAELTWFEVEAVVDGDLPADDHASVWTLP